MLIIFFILFNHSVHKDFSCTTCHNMEKKEQKLSSDKKECGKCHKKKVINFKLNLDKKIKFNHKQHQFLDCKSCHKTLNRITNPKMDSCIRCHKKEKKNSCESCHKYEQNLFKTDYDKKIKPKSHYRVNFKKIHIVSDQKSCLNCHQKRECIDCHLTNRRKIDNFHPEDYLTIHKFETDYNSCESCHKKNRDCKACHQKTGIDAQKKRDVKNYKVHPDGWMHGVEAQKDITKCISCHKENDCLECHKEKNNPHKQNLNICNQKKRLEKSCLRCHKKSYINEKCF